MINELSKKQEEQLISHREEYLKWVDVYCAVKERHDNITLEPGIWEIDRAQEYDHLTSLTRKIAD